MTREQIKRLVQLQIALKIGDYKIIKAYEYHMAGGGIRSPYDIATFHTEREAMRVEIRSLEESAKKHSK